MRTVLLVSALICAGCTQLPELGQRVSPAAQQAPYPALVPLEPLLNSTADTRISDTTDPELQARAAALKARAAQMQQAAGQ